MHAKHSTTALHLGAISTSVDQIYIRGCFLTLFGFPSLLERGLLFVILCVLGQGGGYAQECKVSVGRS